MISFDKTPNAGISSFQDLILPMLPLPERIHSIFSSLGDRGSKWDQVWIAFQAKSIQIIENLSDQKKPSAEKSLKKIHTTALKLLGTDTPTFWEIGALIEDMCEFDAIFDKGHTRFLERLSNPECFWKKSPSNRLLWIRILLKRGFFFQASRILTKLLPENKTTAQLSIAIDLVNRGEIGEALDLLPHIDDKDRQLNGYEAIAISYLNQGKHSKILPFLEDLWESHSDQYGFCGVLKGIGIHALEQNKFNLALEIATAIPPTDSSRDELIKSIALSMTKEGIKTENSSLLAKAKELIDSLPDFYYGKTRAQVQFALLQKQFREALLLAEEKRDDEALFLVAQTAYQENFPEIATEILDKMSNEDHKKSLQLFLFSKEGKIEEANKLISSIEFCSSLTRACSAFAEALFQNGKEERLFLFLRNRTLLSDLQYFAEKALNTLYDAGHFGKAFHLLSLIPSQEQIKYTWSFHALVSRYRWNQKHSPDSILNGRFESSPQLSDELIEAFEAGRYAKAVELLQKESSSLGEEKKWFKAFLFFLLSSKDQAAAANCLDCIPTDWPDISTVLTELRMKMNFYD